jgi:hypothetical protein
MNKNNQIPIIKNTGNLGITLWLVLTIFAITPIIDHLVVILSHGFESYSDGLRIANSKKGILNTGEELSFFWNIFIRMPLIFFSGLGVVWIIDVAYGKIKTKVKRA